MSKKKKYTPKVFVATLSGGMVHHQYSTDLAIMCLMDRGRTIKGITQVRSARSHMGRNKAIKQFLDSECDWLLWIDSDMGFGYEGTYLPLLDEMKKTPEAKILNSLAFIWFGDGLLPNIYRFSEEERMYKLDYQYEFGSRFWCDATGVAWTMIHREVFEKMTEGEWHEDHFAHPDTGKPMGHDIAFFHKAGKLGYKVRYVADSRTDHLKTMPVNEAMYATMLRSQQQ